MRDVGAVTAILVVYDSEEVVSEALEALPPGCKVICVDNGSRDRSREVLARYDVEVIASENIGFARACNLAAKAATTEYLLFLNPDVVLAPGSLNALLEASDCYPEAAVFCPRIVGADGQTMFRDYSRIERWKQGSGIWSGPPPVGDCCTHFFDGSVFLMKRDFFISSCGFDPNIFLYFEDDDFSYRLQSRKAPIIYVHGSKALHYVSSSSAPSIHNIVLRNREKKRSEYYVRMKYNVRAMPVTDAVAQFVKILWYGLTFNSRQMFSAAGRLIGIAGLGAARRRTYSGRP